MYHSLTSFCSNHFRFGIIIRFVVLMLSTIPALSSTIDSTTIVIVGTVHAKTDKFTYQALYDILERIKPDLILCELDSSFFTPSMSIKPEFIRISLENMVVADYQNAYNTMIRPYDIEGRNKIYSEHNYFERQKEFSKALSQADKDNQIQGESAILLDVIDRFDQIGQAFGSESPVVINSGPCFVAMEAKQFYANDGLVKIVNSVPVLKEFTEFVTFKRDFWITRNEAMTDNILKWSKLLHPGTIIVLCGFEHSYYIRNALNKQNLYDTFKLREYWTY